MNKNIELFKISTYNLKKINYAKCIINEDEIKNEILNDNSYHIQYKNTDDVIIFFDIDHVETEDKFNSIIKIITDFFDIDNEEISYTKSIKIGEFSYHISIPKYYMKCCEIKNIIENFKNMYPSFSQYFDNSIYKKTNIFRLPYQTNKDKNISHCIIQGYPIDFIINHIGYFCKNFYESDIYKYNFKNKHIINTNIIETKQIIEKKIEIKQDINKIELQLFNILDIKRLDNYNEWIKLGFLIYSLYEKNGIELYIELSKKSTKFKSEEEVIQKYNTFSKRIYSIRTLHYLCKRDNPEEYNKIIAKVDNYEEEIINPIFIDKRYLLDINSKLDNNNDLLTSTINNFFDNNNLKCLSIKSPYDTGKTQLLKSIITKYNQPKISFISYRISLSVDLLNNFKDYGFKSYLDNDYDSDRLIIQIESLQKLSNNDFIDEYTEQIKQYDLIIIDECESVLNQFNSPTFKNQSKETFEYFTELLRYSNKSIFLDGDLSHRGYSFINSISSEQINIINNIKMEKKPYNIINDRNEYINNIISDLNNNKNICIVSQSRSECDNVYNLLTDKFKNKVIKIYTSFTDDLEKKKDVNIEWKCDCLIYSPTIEAGVSFDHNNHFDKIYGILCNNTTSQRSYMQMLSRIRKLKSNIISILNDKMFKLRKNNINYYNYNDISEEIKLYKIFEMKTEYIKRDNKLLKINSFDNYSKNYIYNIIEQKNKESYYFLNKLKNIIESKNGIFNFIEKTEIKNIIKFDKPTNKLYELIINSNDITHEQYIQIENSKKNNECTEENKIISLKYYYCHKLCLSNINLEILKMYYNNTSYLNNFLSIVDVRNFQQNEEAGNIIKFNKQKLINNFISNLGFLNIFDNTHNISNDKLCNNFYNLYNTNELFKSAIYNIKKININTLTSKHMISYINSIISSYSIKIESHKNKKYGYNIKILNYIDEILYNKIINGYKIHDERNLFYYDEADIKLKHLY